ncbi:MAG: PadR family transcriptional regulator [Fervidobacterium sp.]
MRRKCGCQHKNERSLHRCEETGFSTGDFLTAVILKLIKKEPMHGYDLYERLNKLEYYPFKHDPGVVYNILRKLENYGVLTYTVKEGNGGLRKIYSLTKDGEEYLRNLESFMQMLRESFEKFLENKID